MTQHNDKNTARPTNACYTGYRTAGIRRRRFAALRCEPLGDSGVRDPDNIRDPLPPPRPETILFIFSTTGSAGLSTEDLARAAPYLADIAEALEERLRDEDSLPDTPRGPF